MSFKDKLWVLYCVQQSGKFGLGKASRILEPLSENEETALVQLESWANDKKEVLIEYVYIDVFCRPMRVVMCA